MFVLIGSNNILQKWLQISDLMRGVMVKVLLIAGRVTDFRNDEGKAYFFWRDAVPGLDDQSVANTVAYWFSP